MNLIKIVFILIIIIKLEFKFLFILEIFSKIEIEFFITYYILMLYFFRKYNDIISYNDINKQHYNMYKKSIDCSINSFLLNCE